MSSSRAVASASLCSRYTQHREANASMDTFPPRWSPVRSCLSITAVRRSSAKYGLACVTSMRAHRHFWAASFGPSYARASSIPQKAKAWAAGPWVSHVRRSAKSGASWSPSCAAKCCRQLRTWSAT